ncbi:MAG: RNA polymerase sporulation sigma factor SigH [Armatimonadota bacterium]
MGGHALKEEKSTLKARSRLAWPRYEGLSDQDIVKLAQANDVRASEHLLYKYRGLVRTKVRSYFLVGADREDLLQIGMIGLWQSIMDYSPDKQIPFLSFARICVERHVITAIKAATRRKQSPLNNAVSLDYFAEEPDCDYDLSDVLVSDTAVDPEELFLERETAMRRRQTLRKLLSDFEWEVFSRYNRGSSYCEIARELTCKTKSVDNALGRIRRKLQGARAELVG